MQIYDFGVIGKFGASVPGTYLEHVKNLQQRLEHHFNFHFFKKTELTFLEILLREFVLKIVSSSFEEKDSLDWAVWNMFCDDLDQIANLNCYQRFVEEFIASNSSHDKGNILGNKFEIHQASNFSRRGINFTRSEKSVRPDFIIHSGSENFGAECTTVRFENRAKSRDKILDKMKKKVGNKDANYEGDGSNTILFIEITDFYLTEQENGRQSETNILIDELADRLENIGAIVCNSYNRSGMEPRLGSMYTIRFTSSISSNLKMFLDEFYPQGHVQVEKPSFPSMARSFGC